MKRLSNSIRTQLILLTIVALLILAGALEAIHQYQQREVLINSERRVGLTLIRSVNTTINSVRSFISTLSDIAELDTRLAELVQLNANIDFIAVTDAEGSVIFHSDDTYQGLTLPELARLPSETTVSKDVTGYGEVFLTSLSFDSSDLREPSEFWIVVASASEPIQEQLVSTAFSSLLVTAVFTIIVALIIIAFVQTYFVRPLEQMTDASKAIESGNLNARVVVRHNNEIGQLGRSFNSMTQQLASSINTLEQRVKERTQALEIARDQAERASRAKSDFLSNMSHELRTPLNMVIGYTSSMLTMPQMYQNATLPEVFQPDIQLIQDSGKHLLALINDILDLSKVEAGKLRLSFMAVDLIQTFDGVVAASLGLIGDKPLQVRQNYPESLPKIWGDPVRVRQILLNLLSNAIKFTETGSVTLTAEVRGSQVYIAITDTGPGLPESALSTIFDRFEQYQNNADVKGTGLGLDISQRLAQLHGSRITIDSKVGMGSTFAFTLPIATEAQLQQHNEPALKGNAELFRGDSALRKTALIIATDASIRQTLRHILESRGIVVVEASSHRHAAELAVGLLPDFILLDEAAEGIDRRWLFDTLKTDAETRSIPLIHIVDSDGQVAPASPGIHKPITPEQTMQVIQTVSQKLPAREE